MKLLAVFGLALVLMAQTAYAEASVKVRPTFVQGCYTQEEAIADQAIRIHSELMVIGLNCQHMTPAGQKNLYQSYREFTSTHSGLFAAYENTLLGYFQRTGSGNAESDLNKLRTEFANKISLDVAKTRPDLFCNHYIPRIQKASTMGNDAIQKWASTFFPGHPPSRPICQ